LHGKSEEVIRMDWFVAAPWSEQEAFPAETVATLLAWYSVFVAVPLLVLSVAAVMIVYRRRRLWCVQAERIAEVEFEEVGLPGCRRAAAVYSCSLFSPDVRPSVSGRAGVGPAVPDADHSERKRS
jgi:hypothetical protein